jgi:hypothetical protein
MHNNFKKSILFNTKFKIPIHPTLTFIFVKKPIVKIQFDCPSHRCIFNIYLFSEGNVFPSFATHTNIIDQFFYYHDQLVLIFHFKLRLS